jgi:hypothetical protein
MLGSHLERNLAFILISFVLCALLPKERTLASGISVDAGLTPAEDRWIIRTQIRYMNRNKDTNLSKRRMDSFMVPIVLAYGLDRNLMLLAKLTVQHREISMAGATERDSGLGDFLVLGKYKLYRRNTPRQIFGIAATLGLEMPLGADAFTSGTWDLEPGMYCSWRRKYLGSDFNATYKWNGFADDAADGSNPGDEVALDGAVSYQFVMGDDSDMSLAPVLEISYKNVFPDRILGMKLKDTGESVVYLSPGIKFTRSSFIVEGLTQIPVWQDQRGDQLERGLGGLLGIRYMF